MFDYLNKINISRANLTPLGRVFKIPKMFCMVLQSKLHACTPWIIVQTECNQTCLNCWGAADNSGRALLTLKCNKIVQYILLILNALPLQNRHFDQFFSFGMISVWLRNDIGIVITRKKEIYTNAFFYEFSSASLTLLGRVFKIHDFFSAWYWKK